MTKGSFLRAAVVSLVIAALFPLIYVWIFGGGTRYEPPPGGFEAFHRMSYAEQEAWTKDHSIQMSRNEALVHRLRHPGFWKHEYLVFAFPLSLVIFVSCIAILAWEHKASSNKLFQPTLNLPQKSRHLQLTCGGVYGKTQRFTKDQSVLQ